MWTSNLTHICLSVGLSWLSLKRTAHPDQTDLTLVVPVLGTGEETPLVVRGVKESQTEGWWESGTRVWHSAAQKLYKIITPHFLTIWEKSKVTTGEQRTVRFSKIFLTPFKNNYRLRLLLDHFQYLYYSSESIATYLIALGTRLVSSLNRELSNSMVMSRGTSSLSWRQVFSWPANFAMSGSML